MKKYFTDRISIALSIIMSLFVGKLIHTSSLVQKLELTLSDNLIKVRNQSVTPDDNILLVNLDRQTFLKPEITNKKKFVSHIASWFLEQQAGVVILNLPQQWRNSSSISFNTSDYKNISGG